MFQASRGMGKRFTLYAFRLSYGLERPKHHVPDCYFCVASITGVTAKSKHTVQYPNLPSTMRPLPHIAVLTAPKPPSNMTLSESELNDVDVGQAHNKTYCDPTFSGVCSSKEKHRLTQRDMNGIVRDLKLSK
jgi:hypothetical protein